MSGDTAAVKQEITDLLEGVSLLGLRRIKAYVEKRRTPGIVTKINTCTPQKQPLVDWQPKHGDMAKEAMGLILRGMGFEEAPFDVGGEGWKHKFFVSRISQRLAHEGIANQDRAIVSKSSITVTTLVARIVEEAGTLKAGDVAFEGARIAMQGSRDDPGWLKATTRGAGVVMNDEGVELFAAAAKRVAERLV